MAIEVCRGTAADYADIIDFGNMVFQLDFKELIPKLYAGHPEIAECHHLVKEDGKIKAMVGSFPLTFRAGETQLDAACIGSVSVHLYSRGKNYMKTLMAAAIEEAREAGKDFLFLGGQRQRYEYFGFSKCTQERTFTVTPTNRRHCKFISTQGIELKRLAENGEYTGECQKLLQSQPFYMVRKIECFAEICTTWQNDAWVILKNGEFLGYGVLSREGGSVSELILNDDQQALPVIFAIVEKMGCAVNFVPAYWQKGLIRGLNAVAESVRFSCGEMVRIFNYPKVLQALLQVKANQAGILDGSLCIEIRGAGRFRITSENQKVTVCETAEEPAWSLDPLQAQMRLFDFSNLWQYDTQLENSWFPIPFQFNSVDQS